MSTPLSMVLVTVDCLRADHVGFMGYGRPTTPFLDSLASESFVVPNAIVGGVPTYYSFPAILASRHPLAIGRDLIGLVPGETTLPSYLKHVRICHGGVSGRQSVSFREVRVRSGIRHVSRLP